ncbi:hypothetical protein BCV71DRAFT_163754, partial [Rhizopus microsporus]
FKKKKVSVQRRIPISQLRRLYINSSRILDIHYPDHHLVSLFIHKGYEAKLSSQLNKFAITVRDEHVPLIPQICRDKVDYAFGTFADRLICAIFRIRTPVQCAVARFFIEKDFFFL